MSNSRPAEYKQYGFLLKKHSDDEFCFELNGKPIGHMMNKATAQEVGGWLHYAAGEIAQGLQKAHAPLIEAAEKIVQDCDNEIRLGGQVCCDHEALRKAIAEAKGELK